MTAVESQCSSIETRSFVIVRGGFAITVSMFWEGDAPVEPLENKDFSSSAARQEPRPPVYESALTDVNS